MKKTVLITLFCLALMEYAGAQELGIRFGSVTAGNVAIDGIFSTGKFSRLHADLSFGSGMGADLLWDFRYKQLGKEPINWYLGAGPYMLVDDPFWFGVAGEAGLEYRFNSVPLAIGLDWRPRLSIVEVTDFHPEGFGFNIRYVF